MYELANLDEEHYTRISANPICEEIDESQEEIAEYELDETEQDDAMDSTAYEEQTLNEESEQELDEDLRSIIKIEKVKASSADEGESFDYFEEIIGEESEDQKYMETEYIKEEHEM